MKPLIMEAEEARVETGGDPSGWDLATTLAICGGIDGNIARCVIISCCKIGNRVIIDIVIRSEEIYYCR